MDINPKIFRAYDIRGVYQKDFDEGSFYKIAKVFVKYLNKKEKPKIAIGRDLRLSSKPLAESFIKGLLESGCDVVDLGKVTTPMFYFAVGHLGVDGGAMITASHNPPEYNGIKFVGSNAMPIGGKDIEKAFNAFNFKAENGKEKGVLERVYIAKEYINEITRGFKINRRIKINIDTDSSVVGLFFGRFCKRSRDNFIKR